jgi:hypothetical protein
MENDHSGWVVGGFIVAIIFVICLNGAYRQVFSYQIAYLYDPASDDIYRMELTRQLYEDQKWEYLLPFQQLSYDEPGYVEYMGGLVSTISEFKSDEELFSKDYNSWRKKMDRDAEKLELKYSSLEYFDIEYFRRPAQKVKQRMPENLYKIFEDHEVESNEISMVDAVITHNKMSDDYLELAKPATITIVREVFLIKGVAANILSEQGLL